mgnify:CR=1 FL=1
MWRDICLSNREALSHELERYRASWTHFKNILMSPTERLWKAETGISFLLVSALGMAFAVLLWLFPHFSAVMEPYLVVLNSLPKSALAPLLIVWMGANVKTIITAGISVAIFGSVISIYSSFQSVEPDSSA